MSGKARIIFQNYALGYMTKTLNQIIFFFLHQIQNIFFSNIGNQNIFLGKKHNPPFKLNGRSLTANVINVANVNNTLQWNRADLPSGSVSAQVRNYREKVYYVY